jgi:hypothetical protein
MHSHSSQRWLPLALVAACAALAGCVSFYPLETTPEGIIDGVRPGDVVRLATRDRGEIVMRVRLITQSELEGRVEDGSDTFERVRFDRIESIDIERLNLKKAMLTTFVPAVIAAVIACNNTGCQTRSIVTATP